MLNFIGGLVVGILVSYIGRGVIGVLIVKLKNILR